MKKYRSYTDRTISMIGYNPQHILMARFLSWPSNSVDLTTNLLAPPFPPTDYTGRLCSVLGMFPSCTRSWNISESLIITWGFSPKYLQQTVTGFPVQTIYAKKFVISKSDLCFTWLCNADIGLYHNESLPHPPEMLYTSKAPFHSQLLTIISAWISNLMLSKVSWNY